MKRQLADRRPGTVGRALVRVAVSGVAMCATLALAVAAPASGAPAAPVGGTFTWTGADVNAPTPDANWSDGANWLGGTAPTAADGPVDLVLAPPCPGGGDCNSVDDVAGLVASNITVPGDDGTRPFASATVSGTTTLTVDGTVNSMTGGEGVSFLSLIHI